MQSRRRVLWQLWLWAAFALVGVISIVWASTHDQDRSGLIFGPLFVVIGVLAVRAVRRTDRQRREKPTSKHAQEGAALP
jgi:drug/metabolite transporter (DMT)-like permease